jgi:DNA-binding LytR/AlgR family response regulator
MTMSVHGQFDMEAAIGMVLQRILIVEDDPLISLDLEATVEEFGHAVAGSCASIAEAAPFVENGIDAAVLDIDVLDGKTFGLARRLRERGLPFIFVSGSARTDLPADLQDAPFHSKPFRGESVMKALADARLACKL